MKLKFILGLLILPAIFSFSFGQIQPDKTQISAQQELNTKYNNGIKITWDKRNGSPEIITFSNPKAFNVDQEYSAEIFINEIAGLLKYRSNKDALVIIKQNENKGVKHFRFQQKYERIPVKGGGYVVTVLNDGRIQTALGSFYKDISVDSEPSISSAEALKIALKNQPRGITLKDSLKSSELIIYPKDGNYFLAYKLHVKAQNNPETWSYVINAHNGEVLKKKVMLCTLRRMCIYITRE
jgi:bacillolysin